MSFRPIKVVVFFSALVGASFVMSGVARADSTPEEVVYEVQDKNEMTSDASVTTQEVNQDNSSTIEISSDSSQTAIISNINSTVVVSNDNENTGSKDQTTTNDNQNAVEVSGDDMGVKTSSNDLNNLGELQNSVAQPDSIVLTNEPLTNDAKVKIKAAIDQARVTNGLVRPSSIRTTVKPAVVKDSGATAVQAKNSPAPVNPSPLPIGGFGQFTALLNRIILPVSQLSFGSSDNSVLPWTGGLLSLPVMLALLTMVGVSLFVANLRKSGFSHAARSDVPAWNLNVVAWCITSMVSVAVTATPSRSRFLVQKAFGRLAVLV